MKKKQVFFGVRSGTVLLEISWTYITNNPWWYQLIFLEIGRYRICQWQRLCLFSAIIWKANRNIQIQTGQICLKSPFRNSMQHVEESTVWKVGIYRFPEAPQFHRWTDFQEIRIPPQKKHQHFKVDFSANFVRLFFWGGDIMISTSKPTTVKTLSLHQRHIVQRCTSLGKSLRYTKSSAKPSRASSASVRGGGGGNQLRKRSLKSHSNHRFLIHPNGGWAWDFWTINRNRWRLWIGEKKSPKICRN